MILSRWLSRIMGVRILAGVAAMVVILQMLDLFETTTRILDRGQGVGAVFTYAALRTPHLVEQAAPVGVLAGAVFAFGRLARENAVTALRAGGMSVYRVVMLASPAALATVVLLLALSLWAAPRADRALADWWRATTPAAAREARGPQTFRLGPDIVTAAPGDERGRRLTGVSIYHRAADGRVTARTTAAEAWLSPTGWRLRDVGYEIYDPRGVRRGRAGEAPWTGRIPPVDARGLFAKEPVVSSVAARRALAGGAAPRSRAFYRLQLDRMWAGPAAALVMLLLAAPCALGAARDGSALRLTLRSVAAGLGFLVVDGLCVSAGAGGAAPPLIAAWAAPVLFSAGAVTALLNLEG